MANQEQADNSAFTKRVRRHVTGRVRAYFAITAPGFEKICRQELIDLGMQRDDLVLDAGGVTFRGRLTDCQRANLHLRTATRILMRIDAFRATNLRRLEKKAGDVPWELFLPPGDIPRIKVSCHHSRLHHTAAIARCIRDTLKPRLKLPGERVPSIFPQTLFVRVVHDRFTLSLDSSGEALYKRGLKTGPARAPIRETLAAAILMAAGYDAKQPLVDPLCGSGTFCLEAAMMAKQMAPGLKRTFALMGWPAFRQDQWAFLKQDAQARAGNLDRPLIFASDIEADTVLRLADTIAANGLSDAVRVAQKDVFECEANQYDGGPGLVAINPPYGIRLGSAKRADALFKVICRHLAHRFKGWKVALIAPRRNLAGQLPFAARRIQLLHGGLKLTLIVGTVKS